MWGDHEAGNQRVESRDGGGTGKLRAPGNLYRFSQRPALIQSAHTRSRQRAFTVSTNGITLERVKTQEGDMERNLVGGGA